MADGCVRAARLDCGLFPVSDRERELLKEAGVTELVEIEGYDTEEVVAADPQAILVISGYVPRKTIERLEHCQVIIRLGIGYDKIDLEAATEKGIIVCNTVGYCVNEVAEHAMALLLGCARRIPVASASMRDGSWPEVIQNIRMRRVHGKTLGLVGFGAIGKCIAEEAKGFHMNIVTFDNYIPEEAVTERGAKKVTLDELLEVSDFICMTCPLNDETREMIGKEQFDKMKDTAVFINTARGGLVDEKALAQALKEKKIEYAGIDVYEHINIWGEVGNPPDGYYHDVDNILLTPHIAYISDEADKELYEIGLEQLKIVLSGGWSRMCVNPKVREKLNR
jgi:D-3-phosphoglycerate dehydrogenase